jgi:hypothetical protein
MGSGSGFLGFPVGMPDLCFVTLPRFVLHLRFFAEPIAARRLRLESAPIEFAEGAAWNIPAALYTDGSGIPGYSIDNSRQNRC